MKRIDPRLSPEQLRARAFRYVVKARQAAERAEDYFRAADRRERRAADKIAETWPWPCHCGAMYATEAELAEHKKKCSEARARAHGDTHDPID